MRDTHCPTHSSYDLEVLDIFEVNRHGEDARFSKFEDNENRMLLWHGSRLTNFVGNLKRCS